MSWLSSIGFLSPWALLLAATSPLLVLAYLNRRTLKAKTVSSTLLLRSLEKRKKLTRQNIKLPLRFFLELLAFLLLVAAISQPFFFSSKNTSAILLDTSLSMKAKAPATGISRFEKAKESLRALISQESTSMQYVLLTSAPYLKKVNEEPVDRSRALELLSTIKPTLATDSLSASVQQLMKEGRYDKLVVISDKEFIVDQGTESKELLNKLAASTTTLKHIQIGDPRANLFISDTRIKRGNNPELPVQIAVSIGYSGSVETEASLRLYETSGEAPKKGSTALESKIITASPDSQAIVEFNLKPGNKQIYYLELVAESEQFDSIPDDNIAWVTSEETTSRQILVVSPDSSNDAFGLSKIPGLSFELLKPIEFAALSTKQLEEYSLLMFHKVSPSATPDIPTLLLVPPGDNPLFPGSGEVENPVISSWSTDHPLTTYLNVPLLTPPVSVTFPTPPWARTIISSEEGAIVVAGESAQLRFLAIGFELLPFEGKKTPASTIFLLNSLNWLLGGVDLVNVTQTGTTLELDERKSWIVKLPTKDVVTLSSPEEDNYRFSFSTPGIYKFHSIGGDTKLERSEEVRVANVFHPAESTTMERGHYIAATETVHEAQQSKEEELRWLPLALAAFVILLLESLLFALGRQLGAEQ